jgi:hypothetical protein
VCTFGVENMPGCTMSPNHNILWYLVYDWVLRLKTFDLQECKNCFSAPLNGPDGEFSTPNSSLGWLLSNGLHFHDEIEGANLSPVG